MLEKIRSLLQTDERDNLDDYHRVLLPTTREEVIITGAEGATVDLIRDGERYHDVIDGTSQVGTNPFGHRYGPLMDAVREIYEEDSNFPIMLAGQDSFHPLQRDLAEKFTEIYPGSLSNGDLKTYYCNSGSEAVERGCLKSGQLYKGGNTFIGFENSFHGRTSLALSHTSSNSKYTEGFRFLARTLRVPFASKTGGELADDPDENVARCLDMLEAKIDKEGASNINSMLVEPLQGEGGYNVPHPAFMKGLREIATDHDIPFIVDEVQASLRTGHWFGIENFDVQPDMVAVAKAFSGGVTPFGASLVKDEFATDDRGKHSGTFGGNPKDCLIALRTIELIEENDLLENARQEGEYLKKRFSELEEFDIVKETRGIGLFQGIEIQQDGNPAPALRDKILHRMLENHHVMTESCGNDTYNPTIRFLLPLTIEREETERVADALENTVRNIAKGRY